MSVTSISSINPSQPPPISLRSQEDQAGRQLELALQSGDLAGAQQAYNKLAAFGPNNSGPFVNAALAKQFAVVGQALQAGDLGAAQQATAQLGTGLLKRDLKIARQEYKDGGWQGAQKAIANLEGDYWAVTGKGLPISSPPKVAAATGPAQAAPAINVQA
jgi:hypothetical protein